MMIEMLIVHQGSSGCASAATPWGSLGWFRVYVMLLELHSCSCEQLCCSLPPMLAESTAVSIDVFCSGASHISR
jgi:hypothetical protein